MSQTRPTIPAAAAGAAAASIVLAVLGACTSPARQTIPPPPDGRDLFAKPWTDVFEEGALLVADEVRIEGPQGLLDHVFSGADPADHEQTVETRPEGFFQEIRVTRPGGIEIRARLDAWRISALRRLTILERTAPVDVLVEARGEAFWHRSSTGEERRSETLTFGGEVAR